MELIYIWIKEYRSIFDKEYNFSEKYAVSYLREQNEIKYKKNEYNNDFFGKSISNITAIAGNNGSGKTSILRAILLQLSHRNTESGINSIFGLLIENELVFFSTFKNNSVKIVSVHDAKEEHCEYLYNIENEIYKNALMKNKIIYMNNNFDFYDYSNARQSHVFDFSLCGLIKRDYTWNLENNRIDRDYDRIINYQFYEGYKQLDFVHGYKENKNNLKALPFKLPIMLHVFFRNINKKDIAERRPDFIEMESENYTAQKKEYDSKVLNLFRLFNNDLNKYGTERKVEWAVYLINCMIVSAFNEICISPVVPGNPRLNEHECFFMSLNEFSPKNDLLGSAMAFFKDVLKNLNKTKSHYASIMEAYVSFIEWIHYNYEKINFNFKYDEFIVNISDDDEYELFKQFYEHYRKTTFSMVFFDFSWGLSSGENNLLSLYSRFYYTLHEDNNMRKKEKLVYNNFHDGNQKCNNILILLDEPDLTFHPEWQRKYIKALLEFLPTIYDNCGIQIIFTTHSPILLSDIPSSNIIYLHKDEDCEKHMDMKNIQTFGQNIHMLYKNSFVLDETIGEFAKQKIDMAAEYLEGKINGENVKSEISSMQEAKAIIDIIGEDVIKKALLSKYYMVNLPKPEKLPIIEQYESLSSMDKKAFIKYIIDKTS